MKEAAGPEYTVGVDPNTEFRALHIGVPQGLTQRGAPMLLRALGAGLYG